MKNIGLVIISPAQPAFRLKLQVFLPMFAKMGKRQAFHLMVLTVAFFLSLPLPLLFAEETGALLEQIYFERESSSREHVTFKLNGPHIPTISAIKGEKPKVIFDFYDTRPSPAIKSVIKSWGNLVSAIRIGRHNDPLKTRVVLDLVPGQEYDFAQDFQVKNNTLKITIFHNQQNKAQQQAGEKVRKETVPVISTAPLEKKQEEASLPPVPAKELAPASPAPPIKAVKEPPSLSSSQLIINKISFEQSPDKVEKVVIELNNFHPPVVLGKEEGMPTIICEFKEASAEQEVPAIISTNGNYITQIRVEKNINPQQVKVILELRPNRQYDLQQVYYKAQNLYVLFVKSLDSVVPENQEKP